MTVLTGNNLDHLDALCRGGARAKLVYMDPPFFTQSDQCGRAGSYSDRWSSVEDYLCALCDRLVRVRDILEPNGSAWVHVDWRTSHRVRVLLDDVFGADCFRSEVIWRYRRWPTKTANLQRMHDTIFVYAARKDVEPTFHTLYEPLAPSTLATFGTKRQRADFSTGRRKPGQDDEESKGAPLSDVWEIPIVAPSGKERTGYPTQKPLRLLERIVSIATDTGDLVLDPYCGSGTTLIAAQKLGRSWIGIDENPQAVAVATGRLAALGAAA